MATGNVNLNKDDLQNKYVSFSSKDDLEPTSYDEIEQLESKEKLSDILLKMSILLKNSRYIKNVIGDKNEFSVYSSNLSSGIKTLYNIAEQMSDDISKMINWNLLEGTRLFSGSSWVHLNLTSEYYEGFRINSFTGSWYGVGQKPDFFKVGEVYTFSAYVNFTTDLCTFVTCNDTGGGNASFESRSLPTETGTWARASFTFKVTKDGILNPRFESTAGTLKVCGLKLERGYNDTGWAPNPNDDSLFLSLSGGTMNKDSSIIIPCNEDDRYTQYGGAAIYYMYPTEGSFAAGYGYYDQSKTLLGGIGLYGSKGVPSYYYIGKYSDPFVKVDMDGISTFAKDVVINGDIKPHYSKGIYWRESTYGDQFKIVPTFGGYDDSNMLLIQSAVGEKDTLPDLTTKISIAAKTGNTTFEGAVTSKGKITGNGGLSISGGASISGTSKITGLTTFSISKDDNGGRPTYFLMFDITKWYLNGSTTKQGFTGIIYSHRTNGYMNEDINKIIMAVTYQKSHTVSAGNDSLSLAMDNGEYRPCVIHDTTNDLYYLSLRVTGSGRQLILQGIVDGTLSPLSQIRASDSSGTLPDGYEFLIEPSKCKILTVPRSNALTSFSTSPINSPSDDTSEKWSSIPHGISWYGTAGQLNGQPSKYGFLFHLGAESGNKDVHHLWFTQCGSLFRRYGYSAGLYDWIEMIDSNNYSNYAIPLAGTSSLKGNIVPSSNSLYTLGSDSYKFANIYSINATINYAYIDYSAYVQSIYIRNDKGTPQGYLNYTSSTSIMYSSTGTTTNDTIGINLNSYSNMRLNASSRIYMNASTSISSSMAIKTGSDEKIKKFTNDIEIERDQLINLFDILQVKSYKYRYSNEDKISLGFSAQEIEKACNKLSIDPEKYGILSISYNHYLQRGDEEDMKYYTKYYELSYNDLYNLALLKIQDIESKHLARLESIEERLAAIENK